MRLPEQEVMPALLLVVKLLLAGLALLCTEMQGCCQVLVHVLLEVMLRQHVLMDSGDWAG